MAPSAEAAAMKVRVICVFSLLGLEHIVRRRWRLHQGPISRVLCPANNCPKVLPGRGWMAMPAAKGPQAKRATPVGEADGIDAGGAP